MTLTHHDPGKPFAPADLHDLVESVFRAGRRLARNVSVDNQRKTGLDRAQQWAPEGMAGLDRARRILVVGDLHSNERAGVAAHLAAQKVDADVIVQVGDFGIWPGKSGQEYLNTMEEAYRATGIPLLFVDGNHEDFPQIHAAPINDAGWRPIRPGVVHVPRGHVWTWNGTTFAAMGGASSVDKVWRTEGSSWWPEELVTPADLERLQVAVAATPTVRVDVVFAHDMPDEVPLATLLGSRAGHGFPPEAIEASDAHRKVMSEVLKIAQPSLWLHGHYHVPAVTRVDTGNPVEVVALNLEFSPGVYRVIELG